MPPIERPNVSADPDRTARSIVIDEPDRTAGSMVAAGDSPLGIATTFGAAARDLISNHWFEAAIGMIGATKARPAVAGARLLADALHAEAPLAKTLAGLPAKLSEITHGELESLIKRGPLFSGQRRKDWNVAADVLQGGVADGTKSAYVADSTGSRHYLMVRIIEPERARIEQAVYKAHRMSSFEHDVPVTAPGLRPDEIIQQRLGKSLIDRMHWLDRRYFGAAERPWGSSAHEQELIGKSPSFDYLIRHDAQFRSQFEQTSVWKLGWGEADANPGNFTANRRFGQWKLGSIDPEYSVVLDHKTPLPLDSFPQLRGQALMPQTVAQARSFVDKFSTQGGRQSLIDAGFLSDEIDPALSRFEWFATKKRFQ